MTDEEIQTRILDILEYELDWPVVRSEVNSDTRLGVDGLALDSIMIVETAVVVEIEFGISIPDDEFATLADLSLGTMAEFIRAKMPSPAA
jgi:acyl carrier protein